MVDSLDEAIEHINHYSSQHTEAIITTDLDAARRFTAQIDSSAVMVNASTRFNDGGEFGLGAEIGISTDKFHARGPCGVKELTSYKYVVYGDGPHSSDELARSRRARQGGNVGWRRSESGGSRKFAKRDGIGRRAHRARGPIAAGTAARRTAAPRPPPKPREKVIAYDFKRPERVGKEQMRALQTLHEGFGRNFGARCRPCCAASSK